MAEAAVEITEIPAQLPHVRVAVSAPARWAAFSCRLF